MSIPSNEPPRFVTCHCEHCDGHIEFDASHEGESVSCPHCHMETVISVHAQTKLTSTPKIENPPAIKPSSNQKELFSIKVTSRTAAVCFAFTTFCLASILIWEHLPSRSQPVLSGNQTPVSAQPVLEKQAPSPAQPVPADKISGSDTITLTSFGVVGKYRLDELYFQKTYDDRTPYYAYDKRNRREVGEVSGEDAKKVEAFLRGN